MKPAYIFFVIAISTSIFFLRCHAQSKVGKDADWKTLFNGRDINDWFVKIHHHAFNANFGNTFRVEDSIIKVRYDRYGDFNNQFGHLYYKTPFSWFHLKLEYRFTGELQKGAPSYTLRNSGVMFHSQDPRSMPKSRIGLSQWRCSFSEDSEMESPRPTGNMCSPGTDIVYQGQIAKSHCINSSSKTYDGDQWVTAELIVLGDSLVTHVINGDTVLQYSKPQIGGGVVNRYDPKLKQDGKLLSSGFIALQSEGQPIDFRNIVIRDSYTSQEIARQLAKRQMVHCLCLIVRTV